MREPTDDELRDYLAKMLEIYKKVLASLPEIDPKRRELDPIRADSIMDRLIDPDLDIRRVDVEAAITQLYDHGFFGGGSGYGPYYAGTTEVGERAIKMLTGKSSRSATVPALPQPAWAS